MPYPWSAGNVLTATDLNSALAAKTDLAMVQNAQTGTSYSYALADASKLLSMSNAASNTVLVTKQATVTWVTGTQLRVVNLGAGVTTLVADTGVTINGNVGLKQYQGGTLIRTASDVWLFVPTASSSGMDLITPTSVAGTGVTLSGGQVSFSAVTSGSVNGCFTTAYDFYRILFIGSVSAAGGISARLRAAGSDATAANYNNTGIYAAGASVTGQAFTGATNILFIDNSGVADTASPISMDLFNPALASATTYVSLSSFGNGPQYVQSVGGRHTLSTAYDGLTLFRATGTFTGTLRIYGLRNS